MRIAISTFPLLLIHFLFFFSNNTLKVTLLPLIYQCCFTTRIIHPLSSLCVPIGKSTFNQNSQQLQSFSILNVNLARREILESTYWKFGEIHTTGPGVSFLYECCWFWAIWKFDIVY